MSYNHRIVLILPIFLMFGILLGASGCQTVQSQHVVQSVQPAMPGDNVMPRELSKVILPTYRVEPPDILMIEAVHIVPRPPYRLRTFDVLAIEVQEAPDRLKPGDLLVVQVPGTPSDKPIDNAFPVDPVGQLHLGYHYGSVEVAGLTIEQAKQKIEQQLKSLPVGGLAEDKATAMVFLAESAPSPIAGNFQVQLGGEIDLGVPYGKVQVTGKTTDQAREVIQQHLREFFAAPDVSVTLAESAAKQQITGEHLVGPDGTVTLGSYGSVTVVGLTLAEAKQRIEQHLSGFLEDPEISVNVFAYNSKVYYVITQGAGLGDGVYRFPVTGNETVLDAISQINGLEQVSSKRIWIARPTPQPGNVQVLPVSWEAITAQASPGSNYQILPGDRIFVAEDKLIAFDTTIGKLTAPFTRIMDFAMYGAAAATRFSGPVLRGGGARGSGYFGAY